MRSAFIAVLLVFSLCIPTFASDNKKAIEKLEDAIAKQIGEYAVKARKLIREGDCLRARDIVEEAKPQGHGSEFHNHLYFLISMYQSETCGDVRKMLKYSYDLIDHGLEQGTLTSNDLNHLDPTNDKADAFKDEIDAFLANKLRSSNKLNYLLYTLRAYIASSNGDVDGTIALCDQGLRTAPEKNRFELSILRANTLSSGGQYKRALETFNTLISEDDSYSRLYVMRGYVYRRLGQPKQAIKDAIIACDMKDEDGCALVKSLDIDINNPQLTFLAEFLEGKVMYYNKKLVTKNKGIVTLNTLLFKPDEVRPIPLAAQIDCRKKEYRFSADGEWNKVGSIEQSFGILYKKYCSNTAVP